MRMGLLYQPDTLRLVDLEGRGQLSPSEDTGRLTQEINKALEGYPMFGQYLGLRVDSESLFRWSTRMQGGGAVLEIIRLGEQGLLDRIRQCHWSECRKWFYARFAHQHFCSTDCQQDAFYKTEHWKRHRREYMRRLRARKKLAKKRRRVGK